MVGFKSIALLLSLLIFAACVPQTKQTECASNEAFNAALRTCVPVVNGPSSFININSFLPTTSLTKYKNDSTPITFSVVISNPYAQTYTVEWERIYNGVPIGITPDTAVSYTFAPTLLATELGIHIISVKVKDTSNNIVDSHNFQLVINDMPKPVIQSATVTPALYASAYTPLNTAQNFQFTIYNNSSITLGAGYRTDWKLYRSGVLIDSESDPFTSTSTTGYNYPVYVFDPATLGVGAYVIIARVTNTAADVVAEQQWSATVSHPALSKVINRDIYTGASPAFATSTIAYNGVAYTGSPTYNFIPSTVATPAVGAQGDYCVTVANAEGTYPTDGLYVRVDYYLDGGTIVYSGTTTIGDAKVCLTDVPGTLNAVMFSNSSPTSTQTHTLVARVVDEATGQEYTLSDMNGSLGTYPITWNFTVKPQNAAPSVTFGTDGLPFACTTTTANTKSGCTVISDSPFTVTITPTADDFYYPITIGNEANYDYSIRLYQNGVNIQTCSKTDPDYLGAFDTNGADGYTCSFSIESYNGSGPLNLNSHSYQIQAEISDNGSPISGAPATSSTLTWSFAASGVAEFNTDPAPAVTWSVAGAVTEGSAILFSAGISDPERDNFSYTIKYCTTVGCLTPATLTSGTVIRTDNAPLYTLNVSYVLPEDFLLGLPGLGCDTLLRNQTCAVSFFIEVTDIPNTATPALATSGLGISTITNYNPAPVLNIAFATPAPAAFSAATTFAFVGHPITITTTPAGILNDPSAVTAEKTFRYQWFVKNATSSPFPFPYTAIEGATGPNLVWTPSHIKETNLATDNPLQIMLCVEDHPVAAVASPNIVTSTCSDVGMYATPWIVTVRDNLAVAHNLSDAPTSTELATGVGQYGTETAIWYDTPASFNSVTSSAAYIAMIGNDQKIHVKKTLVRDRGGIDIINAAQLVSFDAVPTGTVDTVKDLSITGTADELYIAYLASRTGSPGSFYPQVRRIELKAPNSAKLAPNNHAGNFGFDYNGLGFLNNCNPIGDCSATQASGVGAVWFNPTTNNTGTFDLQTPNGSFTFSFGVYDGVSTICDFPCAGSTMASQVATIINTSTNPLLAGYSAVTAGMFLVIESARSDDYFDALTDGNARIADRLGKIYTVGSSWFLPFINTSLGGSYNDKLSVYTASTGANMNTFTESIFEPSSVAGLASMDAAIKFDNYLEGANLWIAMVSKTGSAGKLYKVDPTNYALVDTDNIFVGEALLDVQVAASNTNVFVGATVAAGSELKLGVYDINGSMIDEFQMDNLTNVDPLSNTEDIFNTAAISSFRILPYGTEARLFAVSQGTPATTYKLYMARLRTVSSVWTLSCGDCQTVSESSIDFNLSQYVSLGVAPIRDNPSTLYRLSSDGATGAQGIKDVAFVSYGRTDTSIAGSCDPGIGVFNVEGEAIESTTIFSGANPNEDAGLFRPPFIKN
jgi:hypothetical protein